MILRKLVSSVVSRLHPQLCGIERFVGKLKSAGVEFFAGVPVKFTCGYCDTDQGVCANDCINELYQRGLTL